MDPELKEIFFEIHAGLPREGPGCFGATRRAFQMLDLPDCPAILDAGCDLLGHFPLPRSAWWGDYYSPIASKLPSLRDKYHDRPEKLKVIAMEEAELDLHRRFADYYGYVFYVMRRP